MAITLDKPDRDEAINSLQRYFRTELDQEIGNLQAGALLQYVLEEIAPLAYNIAIRQAQETLQSRITELDIDCHEAPFSYWSKQAKRR
jgi:uncharacterized protein (DUF2164 family)